MPFILAYSDLIIVAPVAIIGLLGLYGLITDFEV